ncbi:MAG TPA: hypothetical protein VKP65_04680, partial [Rhodothermales bacterium]|nr:hypothetical protein [Rhodothermales bacterium]
RGQPIDPAWKQMQGRFVTSEFDDTRGGFWQIDLTPAYKGVQSVRRTVVHLFPGIIAVLDEAQLERAEPISLRWHTIDRSEPDTAGRFRVVGEQATLAAQVVRLDGDAISFRRGEHRYEPPYNVGRLDEPLAQRHESYIEALLTSDTCRLLSLFAVYGPQETASLWRAEGEAWQIETEAGVASVQVTASALRVENPAVGSWTVELG